MWSLNIEKTEKIREYKVEDQESPCDNSIPKLNGRRLNINLDLDFKDILVKDGIATILGAFRDDGGLNQYSLIQYNIKSQSVDKAIKIEPTSSEYHMALTYEQ